MSFTLPHEVVDYISEFLWDDVRSLINFSLTCRRYYDAPICSHLLRPLHSIYVYSRRDLDFVSRVLSSKRTRKFYEQHDLRFLNISERSRKPFAHTVPLCISPSHLPHLETISMHSVNWTTFRPPVSFFLRLAQFVSVTRLELSSCRFRFAHDLRRLTNSLPNLAELQLNRISCAFSAVMEQPSHVIQTLAKLDMRLVCLEGHPDSLLATCASYSTVTHLQVQTEWFTSLGHFRNFVEGFPVLTTLTIILGYGRTWDSAVMAGPPSLESHSSVPSLATFTLICYRSDLYHSALIEQTLAWAAGTPSVTTLRDLRIGVAEYSTIAGLTIGLVLEKVSHTLETLHIEWRIPGSTFPLMGDCLETLHLTIHVDEDTRAFERTRYTIAYALSSITSRNLREIHLCVVFHYKDYPACDVVSGVAEPRHVDSLESILSREVFDGLPQDSHGVSLTINEDDDLENPVLDAALIAIPALFAPWDARGILEVYIPRMYRYNPIINSSEDPNIGHTSIAPAVHDADVSGLADVS